eukprot:6198885-Pleurochrysis_carterae.AAC.1
MSTKGRGRRLASYSTVLVHTASKSHLYGVSLARIKRSRLRHDTALPFCPTSAVLFSYVVAFTSSAHLAMFKRKDTHARLTLFVSILRTRSDATE